MVGPIILYLSSMVKKLTFNKDLNVEDDRDTTQDDDNGFEQLAKSTEISHTESDGKNEMIKYGFGELRNSDREEPQPSTSEQRKWVPLIKITAKLTDKAFIDDIMQTLGQTIHKI